ncbi:conserved hypothetical protein [Methanococcus aeolicus Nankai-3]|uniref:DUF2341 domain-containing protein n=1 Tax=Methanococcus aeolicus (strain ATCC BAA-1280 / DSM 17508 / OCM 812 / Nankai-3) TaxID=419665 RepID=A6UVB1_META3|nr:DUF2341 domain-containing protein [Methanococcus aeolicus]ABR56433.1 conserved hypothetical protein [Methanococcus aeolicus Nankai-3]
MYLSQTSITLVLLVFLTSTVFYQTINMKTEDVENTIEIKKIALYSDNIETATNRNLEKIVNDVFVNISYGIMNNGEFYNSAEEARSSIEKNISKKLNNSLSKLNDKNITISVGNVSISHTNDPLIVNVKCDVNLDYTKEVNGITISSNKNIELNKDIILSKIPDPYVYKNNFYYEWNNEKEITVNNMPNNEYHTFYIILNNSNFNYGHMNNSDSPNEIRIIGKNKGKNNIVLPYWVQTWKQGTTNTSIIWVNCSRNELFGSNGNPNIKIIYNSTTKIDRQNPKDTFILFDTFDNTRIDGNTWNVSGGYYIDNSKLIVQGLGSSVWTNKTYGTGYELMFKGNFTPVHAQAVGFFEPKSDYNGVGWDCYNWSDSWLYMRNGSGGSYVPNGYNYLNEFHTYGLKRISEQNLTFTILNDTLDMEYTNTFNNGDNDNNYPISINTFTNSNATISIDWIFLKDVNDITATVGAETTTDIIYNELKPKTMIGTIYYGDPEQYIYVNGTEAGNYSIIGILTNTTDSWGTVGYKPKIEIE